MSEAPDTDLIQAALDGVLADEDGAGDRLCRLLEPELAPIAAAMLRDAGLDPRDVVQDSLLAVLAYLGERGAFSGRIQAFAATVVRNRCLDLLRRKNRFPHVSLDKIEGKIHSDFLAPLDALVEAEVRAGLGRALAALDARCRDLLVSFFYKRKSVKDLKEEMGVASVQVVYYRKGVCLEKLRRILKDAD